MKDFLNKTTRSVSNVAQSAKGAVAEKATVAAQIGRKAAFSVENKAVGIRDSARDLATGITGTSAKIILGVTGTVSVLVNIGIPVIGVVAPVPTFIGLGLLWLIQLQLTRYGTVVDDLVADERYQRKLERVTGLMKKYGQIPETAILETDLIRMVIDNKKGEVTGHVLAGEFQERELNSLSDVEIERLMKFAPDDDTQSIIEAYQSLRQAKSANSATSHLPS